MSSPDIDKFKSDYSDIIHVKDFNVIKDLSPASKLVNLFILKMKMKKGLVFTQQVHFMPNQKKMI